MTHSRHEFTSRAAAPSDLYRRMFATLCAPARRAPFSHATQPTSDAPTRPHLTLISPTIQLLTPEAKNFSDNSLISLTKVIKSSTVYCNSVTYDKSANNVWRISGKRNKSRDLSGMPSVHSALSSICLHVQEKKSTVRNHYYLSSSIIDRYYPI